MYEYPLDIARDYLPDTADLQEHAPVGLVRRGLARYLFPRNAERSVRLHTYLGAPLTRALIMKSYGRFIPRTPVSNYRTDPTKSRIEAATRFAVGGSVFNEAVHAYGVVDGLWDAGHQLADGKVVAATLVGLGVNAALVSLQRYNRARMVQRIDQELAAGNGYEPQYTNWLGIDARAIRAYEQTLPMPPEYDPYSIEGIADTLSLRPASPSRCAE